TQPAPSMFPVDRFAGFRTLMRDGSVRDSNMYGIGDGSTGPNFFMLGGMPGSPTGRGGGGDGDGGGGTLGSGRHSGTLPSGPTEGEGSSNVVRRLFCTIPRSARAFGSSAVNVRTLKPVDEAVPQRMSWSIQSGNGSDSTSAAGDHADPITG
ncbi:hypothetical protein Vretimale_12633, partial [Volvox reticuliferus]